VVQACTVVLINIFRVTFRAIFVLYIAVGLLLNSINFLVYKFRFTVQLPTNRQV
jgi:hypothetical protein